ncbi:MAG: 16S rRNA (cytosine(1402)-N(4))-methyltransferase RsmH, partial [Gammaproteobacteria bacterium]|nr:16S rRNA (cytosine(1402)-N(4))-methyltransferase RsmH [Gammaproteobacteria bacterium]
GFSFLRDGPLDMRMDPESGVSAADWLRAVDERSLKIVLRKFGEETQAARIARAIVASRRNGAIETTGQLANIISSVIPAHTRKKHPATRTFQAIRIFINKELEQLEAALAQSIDILAPGGRLCVISFHSLEDRIVKRFMRDASREAEQYRGMPDIPEAFRPKLRPIGKLITASADEINVNVRARSARLRIAERT